MTGLPAEVPFVPACRIRATRRAAALLFVLCLSRPRALLAPPPRFAPTPALRPPPLWVINAGRGVGSRQLDRPTTACTIPVSEDGTWAPPMFARNVLPFGIT